MDDNPYRAPLADEPALGVRTGRREEVRSIALYQKGVLVCILLYLCCMIVAILPVAPIAPQLLLFLRVGVLLVSLTGMVFVFLMATKNGYPVGLFGAKL